MIRTVLFSLLSFFALAATAQNPSTVLTIPDKTFVVPCGTSCTSITATVPHIRQSNDYLVQAIPYVPFAYVAGGTELTALYADDIYSSTISLPFSVCFYGTTYKSLVVGSNGILSFDVTNAGKRNNFSQMVSYADSTPVPIPYAGGLPNTLSRTYYPKAAIMGVFHDIFPFDNGSRRIEWRIEGTAPRRRFIASYNDIPLYSCTDKSATHQIVIYESTGVVEVYVQDKPVCEAWNGGLAILGMQNFNRNKAAFPAGKNASRWGSKGMNEAYRFLPSSDSSMFKRAELLSGNAVVALADTASGANGELNLAFPNVCPAADSVTYLLRVTYKSCSTPGGEVSFEDTVYVKKEKLDVSLRVQNPTCVANGTINVDASGTGGSFLYGLNGGPTQSSPQFSNLKADTYEVSVSNGTCVQTATTALALQNDLSLTAQTDTLVCSNEAFTPRITSNGTSFNWSPATGVSDPGDASPKITAQNNTDYTLTVVRGICQQKAVLNVKVKPSPVIDAGPDQTIVQGDVTQLAATAPAGNYNWSPTNGLNSGSVLNPSAMPSATTTYKLSVTAGGCTASDEVTVHVESFCLKPMEAFTPNNDGINDFWLLTTGNCLKQAKVDVFNRYGAIVYHSDDYKNNWNGSYQGKPLPDGTYYYIVTGTLINNKAYYLRGNVTILR